MDCLIKKVPGKEMIQTKKKTMHGTAIKTDCVKENAKCSLDHFLLLLQSRFPGHGDMLSKFKLTFPTLLT